MTEGEEPTTHDRGPITDFHTFAKLMAAEAHGYCSRSVCCDECVENYPELQTPTTRCVLVCRAFLNSHAIYTSVPRASRPLRDRFLLRRSKVTRLFLQTTVTCLLQRGSRRRQRGAGDWVVGSVLSASSWESCLHSPPPPRGKSV